MTIGDERVRASHAVLNGKILPVDHPFWNDHTPPWDWNCRCDVRPIDQDEYDQIQKQDRKKPLELRRVLEGGQLRLLEQRKQLVDAGGLPIDLRSPVEKGQRAPWIFHPANHHLDAALLSRHYPADVWDTFRRWAEKTLLPGIEPETTVWYWMGGRADTIRLEEPPVPVAPPDPFPATVEGLSAGFGGLWKVYPRHLPIHLADQPQTP